MRRTISLLSVSAMGAVTLGGLLAAPSQGVTASSLQVSGDGYTASLSTTASAFGMTYGSPTAFRFGQGTVTEMYPVSPSGGAFVNFLARGGVVKKTGGSCATDGTYYQRAQITVAGLTGTNDVYAFYDSTVGPAIEPTPHFNSTTAAAQYPAAGTNGTSAITLGNAGDAANFKIGNIVSGANIGANARVTGVAGSTVSLSVPNTGTVSGNVTLTKRLASSSQLETLCDGTTEFVTATGATADTIDLDAGGTDLTTAGVKVNDTSAASVSFDVYVPMLTGMAPGDQTGNFLALGILVKGNAANAVVSDSEDTGIFTHIYARPWDAGGMFRDILIPSCAGTPVAGDAPCYVTTDTGIFANDGTTALSGNPTFSVTGMLGGGGGQTILDVQLGLTSASSSGFAIPATSIVKFKISLPTSGTFPATGSGGTDFGTVNFAQAAGGTKLRINPNGNVTGAPVTNRWNFSTASNRRILEVIGEARATSSAVDRNTWREDGCSVSISNGAATSTDCGEGMTSNVSTTDIVLTTVPASFNLSYSTNPVMQTVAGGMVSTNAQGITFGEETMAGTSFQFAVAGPSYDTNGNSRSTDGYYYVCVPQAFLSGSFNTTAASAASSWVGTRDGAAVSASFATGSCGLGDNGLVASLDPFGYSAPLFRVKPPTAAPSSNTSSGSTATTTTTTTSTSTTTPTTTTTSTPTTTSAAPVVYPSLAKGRSVSESYLLGLANWTPSKEANVSISVPRMYRGACAVRDGRVVATGAGTCGVRIKVVSPKGKSYYKRVYLTVGQ